MGNGCNHPLPPPKKKTKKKKKTQKSPPKSELMGIFEFLRLNKEINRLLRKGMSDIYLNSS